MSLIDGMYWEIDRDRRENEERLKRSKQEKIDMSHKCMPCFNRNPYEAMVTLRGLDIITNEGFDLWWSHNCGRCIYMNETCIHGEEYE